MGDDIAEWGDERRPVSRRTKVVGGFVAAAVLAAAGVSYSARHPADPPRPVAVATTEAPTPVVSATATPTTPAPLPVAVDTFAAPDVPPAVPDPACDAVLSSMLPTNARALGLVRVSDTRRVYARVLTFTRGINTVRITGTCLPVVRDGAGVASGGSGEKWAFNVDANSPYYGGDRPGRIQWQVVGRPGIWMELTSTSHSGMHDGDVLAALAKGLFYTGRAQA